jgi:hypothetical protein
MHPSWALWLFIKHASASDRFGIGYEPRTGSRTGLAKVVDDRGNSLDTLAANAPMLIARMAFRLPAKISCALSRLDLASAPVQVAAADQQLCADHPISRLFNTRVSFKWIAISHTAIAECRRTFSSGCFRWWHFSDLARMSELSSCTY